MNKSIILNDLNIGQLRRFILDTSKYIPDDKFDEHINLVSKTEKRSAKGEHIYSSHKRSVLENNTFIKGIYEAIITIAHEQAMNGEGVDTRGLMVHLFNFYPEEMNMLTREKIQMRDKLAVGYILKDAGFIRYSKRPKKDGNRSCINVWTHGPLIKGFRLEAIIRRYENKDIPVSTDTFI